MSRKSRRCSSLRGSRLILGERRRLGRKCVILLNFTWSTLTQLLGVFSVLTVVVSASRAVVSDLAVVRGSRGERAKFEGKFSVILEDYHQKRLDFNTELDESRKQTESSTNECFNCSHMLRSAHETDVEKWSSCFSPSALITGTLKIGLAFRPRTPPPFRPHTSN